MAISLQEITLENWLEAIDLSVRKDQEPFAASNLYSIAQAQFNPSWVPLAIYEKQTMVGFLMYGEKGRRPGQYWIIRLMIDARYQGLGHGKRAMEQAIRLIKAQQTFEAPYTSFVAGNRAAAALYRAPVSTKPGEMNNDEVIVKLEGRG